MLVVDVQPAHHGLRVTPGALGHSRRTGALADLVQGQKALAGARVAGAERQLPQISWRLPPALVVNTYQGSEQSPSENPYVATPPPDPRPIDPAWVNLDQAA